MAENFIKGAIKHPGALHKELGVQKSKSIPLKRIQSAAHTPGKEGERARFALTLRKINKGK